MSSCWDVLLGRAPGVTLATVGIYGAVVEVASGLGEVNQAFNPIFGPSAYLPGMTANGEQGHAATTFSRVAQWMLWILLPLLAVMVFAGPLILSIYGADFRQGAIWLGIVALACGTNCFVPLCETVIMVQRPGINLLNSTITCVVAVVARLVLINSLGATGAAFGILLPYVLLGILRHRTLRLVFGWERPWSNVAPPVIAMAVAAVPGIICRVLLNGVAAQIISAAAFLLVFGFGWWFHFRRAHRAE